MLSDTVLGLMADRHIGGSRLGEYFSVYTTGIEDAPEMDEAPSSSSSASKASSTSGGYLYILLEPCDVSAVQY